MATNSVGILVIAAALFSLPACDAAEPAAPAFRPLDTAALDRRVDAPELPPPSDFVDPAADPNPYFPLVPGTIYTYRAETEDGIERTVDTVTGNTKTILGIQATVVLDSVYLDGVAIEVTRDWYAQDRWGNVWYLGEASCEFEEPGAECDASGSWEAGVDGAEAGIIMWADPIAHKGRSYRQEFYEGEAEDMAKVLHDGLSVSVPAGEFAECIETMDWTPLEPGAREHKFYCAGTGMVLEVQTRGGPVRNELVGLVSS